jgi:creatinine amidohydrolase/Fe(II)-dependent formamide hydrolase-like protein
MMAMPVINNATIVAERLFMGTETDNTNEVYRHFDRVVLVNAHGTQYMDTRHAKALAKELLAFAKDIDAGRYPTTRIVSHGVSTSLGGQKKREYI